MLRRKTTMLHTSLVVKQFASKIPPEYNPQNLKQLYKKRSLKLSVNDGDRVEEI